jgi:hypothetical protein
MYHAVFLASSGGVFMFITKGFSFQLKVFAANQTKPAAQFSTGDPSRPILGSLTSAKGKPNFRSGLSSYYLGKTVIVPTDSKPC